MVSELDKLIKTYHSFECEFDIDKSIEVCKEILEIDPNLIEYQEKLACNYFDIEKYGKSIDLYKKCIEEGGDRETSIFMIALAYVKMNDREKALEYASKAGNKQDYLFNHLRIHDELKEYDKAIEYGDRLLEENPEHPVALHIMSNIYNEINDDDRSLFYLDELANQVPALKALEIIKLYSLERYDDVIEIFEENKREMIKNGELEDAYFNFILGNSYNKLQRPYESLKYLIESDRLNEDIEKKKAIARIYMEIHKYDNAYKYLKCGLNTDPLDEECLFMISKCCYFREELIESVEWANKLLSNHPHNKIFHVLGAVLIELGEYEKAYDYIKTGTNLMMENDEYDGEHILFMARSLSDAGSYERALNIYNHIIKGFPDYHYIYFERAKLYKRMGKKELADNDFRTYNKLQKEWEDKIDSISRGYEYLYD